MSAGWTIALLSHNCSSSSPYIHLIQKTELVHDKGGRAKGRPEMRGDARGIPSECERSICTQFERDSGRSRQDCSPDRTPLTETEVSWHVGVFSYRIWTSQCDLMVFCVSYFASIHFHWSCKSDSRWFGCGQRGPWFHGVMKGLTTCNMSMEAHGHFCGFNQLTHLLFIYSLIFSQCDFSSPAVYSHLIISWHSISKQCINIKPGN